MDATVLMTSSAATVVLAAVGVVGLLYLGHRVLVQGKQPYGIERSREAGWDAGRQSTLDLAELQGWSVEEDPARVWPDDLASARTDGRTCLLAVRGPDFEASTWSAKERLAGAAAGVQSRIWLLRLDAPGVRDELFVRRSSGGDEQLLLLPRRLEGRVQVQEPVGGLFAGGDFLAARERLGPLVGQVAASGSWVITSPGEVTVLATLVPDADGFEWRLDLARRVAAALA